MSRGGHQEINRGTRAHLTQGMQRALSRFGPRGERSAPGTRSLLLVAMIRHEWGGGEAVAVGNPRGGVWYVSSRSVHHELPEEKAWERQEKSDRLAWPDRIQNRCYSVLLAGPVHHDEEDLTIGSTPGMQPHRAAAWCMQTLLPGPIVSFHQVRAFDLASVFKGKDIGAFALHQQGTLMRFRDVAHELGVAEPTIGHDHRGG
jgi:hypothetical protein